MSKPPTQAAIDEELEKQHFLAQIKQLVLQEKNEVKKLKRKHMEIFLNVFLDLLEVEDNALKKIDTIASAVNDDNNTAAEEQPGPSNSAASKNKLSSWLSYLNIFSGTSSSKNSNDNDENEDDNENGESEEEVAPASEDNKVTRDLIPVFIMCALMVREQKKQTAELHKISEKLNQIVVIQTEMAKHLENSNILVKKYNIDKIDLSERSLEIEKEKLEVMKKTANMKSPTS